MGMHHLPHTEDLPLTTTIGKALNFYLLPYNYFPECPSASSRDNIRVELKDEVDRTQGVKLIRYHDTNSQCAFAKSTLEQEYKDDPDIILESKNPSPVFWCFILIILLPRKIILIFKIYNEK